MEKFTKVNNTKKKTTIIWKHGLASPTALITYFKEDENKKKRHGIYPVPGYNHDALPREFNMMSLRKYGESRDMCFIHKIVHGQIDSTSFLCQTLFNVPRISSRFLETFHIPVPNTMRHSSIVNNNNGP